MAYKYENPLDRGYKQFKLTKKQHNELFKYRQIHWSDKYEYYYNEHRILLHRLINWKGIIAETLLSPLWLLMYGFSNTKEHIKDIKKLCNQKEYGCFSIDSIQKGSDTYKKIMNIINA